MKAIQRGVKFGARPKLSAQVIKELVRDFEAPGCSKREIAVHYLKRSMPKVGLYEDSRSPVCR